MSVAAYGSLVSLLQVLDQIQKHHAWGRIRLDTQQVQNFKNRVQYLQELLELHSQKLSKEDMEGLAPGITDAASEAEIIIDRHVVDQLRGLYDDENDKEISAFGVALEDAVQMMDSIQEGLINKIQVAQQKRSGLSVRSDFVHYVPKAESSHAVTISTGTSSATKSSEGKRSMVGSGELRNQILDKLIYGEKSLQVLSLSGMGGIGKTTLAKCIFEDSRIVKRFDRLKWSTISQKFDEREVFKSLLDLEINQEMPGLGVQLHKELTSRRYLIVLDDIWNIEVLDKLKLYLPDNTNGSRVILTTRLLNVAEYLKPGKSYQLDFLTDAESWDLLCEKTFGQQSCPTNLEKFGKEIALSCRGLPLSIITIGGLLSKSDMTPQYWEFVAKNAKGIASSENDEHCLKILYLSYDNLPIHLKLCFLDFANHPEDESIGGGDLIRDWIHLGLVKSVPDQSIEDIAKGYLDQLAERNLIFVNGIDYFEEIQFYGVHDLLRELCIKESKLNRTSEAVKREILLFGAKIEFRYNFIDMCSDASKGIHFVQMVPDSGSNCCGLPDLFDNRLVCGVSPSAFCGRCKMESRWVTVLQDFNNNTAIRYPTQSRILYHDDYWSRFYFTSSILYMWNLQTIYIGLCAWDIRMPIEIWKMQQLRHLIAPKCDLPDPPIGEKELAVLEELQTLHTSDLRLTQAIIERMPNIRELKIKSFINCSGHLLNVSFFKKLESLVLENKDMKSIIFPRSLKKLHLIHCHLRYKDMDDIGSLPDLQVLKLGDCKFEDNMWKPTGEKFLQLKALKIEKSNLNHWEVEQDHFPKLERLCLNRVESMKEIPSDIANIPTMLSIDVIGCSEEITESAKKILEEEQSDLKISIQYLSSATRLVFNSLDLVVHRIKDFLYF